MKSQVVSHLATGLSCLFLGGGLGYWSQQNAEKAPLVPVPPPVPQSAKKRDRTPQTAPIPNSQLASVEARRNGIVELVKRTLPQGTDALLAEMLKSSAADDRALFVEAVMEQLGEEGATTAWEFAQKLPASPFRTAALQHALGLLALKEPQKALELAHLHLKGVDYNNALIAIVGGWGRSAPREALAWVQQQPSEELRAAALDTLAAAWGKTDPQAALAHLSTLGNDIRAATLPAVIGTWSQSQPVEALQWATAYHQRTGDWQPMLIGLLNYGNFDPAAAARLLNNQTPPELLSQAVPTLAANLTSQQPTQGWEFALQQTDPTNRLQALRESAQSWAGFDPIAVATAAGQLPAGSAERGLALETIALSLAGRGETGLPAALHQAAPALAQEIMAHLQKPASETEPGAANTDGTAPATP